ncbi:methyltransferase domain-containing protein [Rubellicoccus peritrichatus]|uniref:Methyltransferase domain-containing protein n=1 Tax=Rubellicoccus peritrichatus TaxID=3080537 RepID=A0AAQ3LAR6_9BACT|nr:methyltransferase domain-containing protein [Puniceicoccus sp. CR14]WOO41817.1 methyltransferase domain-containing protein [Puniceicoccus sp. CR14]
MMARFDQCAHRYANYAFVQELMAEWLSEWLDGVSCPEGTALEYGAGEGLFTKHILNHFRRVWAVDQAPHMIELGRDRVPLGDWMEGDAWQADGPVECADAILSSSLLQWCEDPETVLRRWMKRLRPGGQLLHGFYVSPTLPELSSLLGDSVMPVRWHSAEAWEDAFAAVGFTIERSECQTRKIGFKGGLELLRHLHGIGAINPGRVGAGRLRSVLRRYDDEFRSGDDRVFSSWTFCRIQARLKQ